MNILSIFGGIWTWRLVADILWWKNVRYFESEIDSYAQKIAQANYPDIVHIGDVKNVQYYDGQLHTRPIQPTEDGVIYERSHVVKIDLLIGGSPCQDLSIAKKNWKGLDWEKSWLFYEYVRILKEVRPKYFLLENVASMKQADREKITEVLQEVYPDTARHMINSSLVSAQNRKRLYWTNIPWVTQPEDKWILLRDVLEDIPMDDERWKPLDEKYLTDKVKLQLREKSLAITESYHKKNAQNYFNKNEWQVIVGIMQKPRWKNEWWIVYEWEKCWTVNASKFQDNNFVLGQFRRWSHLRVHADQDNSPTLTSNMGTGGNNVPVILGLAHRNRGEWKQPECNLQEKANSLTTVQSDSEVLAYTWEYYWRKLTPTECERLQTLPDGYTDHVSATRRYKAIGNGWTVDVISHILSFIPR